MMIRILLAAVCLTPAMAWTAEGVGFSGVKGAEVRPESVKRLPLRDGRLVLIHPDTGKPYEVPVVLVRSSYTVTWLETTADGTMAGERDRTLHCYELRSASPEILYSWARWFRRMPYRCELFSDGGWANWLAWVDGSDVYFADVSEQSDKVVELTRYLNNRGEYGGRCVRVPVVGIIGRHPFEGLNALHSDITILSVGRDDVGRMTVRVHGVRPEDVFTLVLEEGEWRKK